MAAVYTCTKITHGIAIAWNAEDPFCLKSAKCKDTIGEERKNNRNFEFGI